VRRTLAPYLEVVRGRLAHRPTARTSSPLVVRPEHHHSDDTLVLRVDDTPISWTVRGATPARHVDPGVALGLMPAMRRARPLRVTAPASRRLHSGLDGIQRLLHRWDERMTIVDVEADTAPRPRAGRGVGLFFSGGVDSFSALRRRRGELTHLVTVRGFDVTGVEDWDAIRAMARSVADAEGLSLVEVETDARRAVTDLAWFEHGHGAVLASVALALQSTLHRVVVGSSRDAATLTPCGTHPDLDPLWSTEATVVEHDDLLSRDDKIAGLVDDEPAMRWLRVCWRRPDLYNCGRCDKCIRTQIALWMAGGLTRCATLPDDVDLRRVRRLRHRHPRSMDRATRLAARVQEAGHPELADALRTSVRRSRAQAWRWRVAG
jgi:hypothetical protein